MADNSIRIILEVKTQTDFAAGKNVIQQTQHVFNDVVSDERLMDILRYLTPVVDTPPV